MNDQAGHTDRMGAARGAVLRERAQWDGRIACAYYAGNWTAAEIDAGAAGAPVALYVGENLLVNAGIQLLEDLLIGAGGTVFSEANAHIGIGDSTTAAAAGQTNLQAGVNVFRQPMDAGFPQRSGQTLTFRATIGTDDGNFAIREAGVFNAASAGTMLNRVVQDLGTKTSATTLQITATITIV